MPLTTVRMLNTKLVESLASSPFFVLAVECVDKSSQSAVNGLQMVSQRKTFLQCSISLPLMLLPFQMLSAPVYLVSKNLDYRKAKGMMEQELLLENIMEFKKECELMLHTLPLCLAQASTSKHSSS